MMRRHLSVLVSALLLLGCSSSDSSGDAAADDPYQADKAPYGGWSATTEVSYDLSMLGVSRPVLVRDRGPKIVGGVTYRRAVIGDPSKPENGAEFWIDATPDAITLAGLDVKTILGAPFVATLDSAVKVALLPPVGAAQKVSGSAQIVSDGDPTSRPIKVDGEYTLVDQNASVDTSVGTIGGCQHYAGSLVPTGAGAPSGYEGKTVTGDLWYHPSHGIVAVKSGAVMLDMGMLESRDCHTPTTLGHNLVRKIGLLDGKSSPQFRLDTYSCSNAFDADKDSHAKMLLELRWAEDAKARQSSPIGPPFVTLDFGTVAGSYPAQLVESPVSVLHPEENGKGYTYYIAYVDQAAKNEAINGISYHVGARVDAGFSPIRASARIYYKTLP
jgi:hypothetical protein